MCGLRAVPETAKTQCHLNRRYRALTRRGKPKTVVITAVARELVGFICAPRREVTSACCQQVSGDLQQGKGTSRSHFREPVDGRMPQPLNKLVEGRLWRLRSLNG